MSKQISNGYKKINTIQRIRRTLTRDELTGFVNIFLEECKTLEDGDEVNAVAVGKRYNVSLSIVKKIVIESFSRGLPRIKLVNIERVLKDKSENPYINNKMSIIIGKAIIEKSNQRFPQELKFKEGDKFSVEISERSIVLTLIALTSPVV